MAKTIGPLMSMTASGAFGKSIKFDKRGYAGKYLVPANPRTVGQANARQYVADIQAAVKTIGATLKAAVKAAAPTSYRWNSYLLKLGIGAAQAAALAVEAAWTGFSSQNKTDWDTAFSDVVIGTVPGTPTATDTAGFCGLMLALALYNNGLGGATAAPAGGNSSTWHTFINT